MNIIISGRHFTVSNELKQDIENRLTDILTNKSLKISTVRVILTMEKKRYSAEIIVNLKHHDIESNTEDYNLHDAVDAAINKVETQVRRYLDKVQTHQHEKLANIASAVAADTVEEEPEYELELD